MFLSQLLIAEHAPILVTLVRCSSLSDKRFELNATSGHEVYPRRFNVDMQTQMLGSVKSYHRQVSSFSTFHVQSSVQQASKIIISTGKSDWERDIEDCKNSLATAMSEVISNNALPQPGPSSPGHGTTRSSTGLFLASDSNRTSILNGSHKTVCYEDDHETVLVFPDFKVVTEVRRSTLGAQDLWDSAVDPSIGRSGACSKKNELKTWVLPYSCVILLC
jgi:hypothetical protein